MNGQPERVSKYAPILRGKKRAVGENQCKRETLLNWQYFSPSLVDTNVPPY